MFSKNGLVDLLTEKEVLMAKIAFSRLDVNKDGSISELEARKVFDEYFSQLSLSDRQVLKRWLNIFLSMVLYNMVTTLVKTKNGFFYRKRNSVGETYAKHALARAMALDVKEMGSVFHSTSYQDYSQKIFIVP